MAEKPSFERVEEVFLEALDLELAERKAFLEKACAGDAGLRAEVESLLAHEGQGMSRFAEVAVGRAASVLQEASSTPQETAEQRAGAYRLLRPIGAGGMGSVWLAVRDDDEFRREVAVKVLRHNLNSEYTLRRFRHERQILAGLHHPNIAALYDGGTMPDGRPFIVMEYVEGPAVTDYSRDHNLGLADKLKLFRRICLAVQHAHRNLIVHRDLKPSNILVNSDGEPKLLDFGIAKLLDPSAAELELTQTSMRMLTPEYASPEQVRGDPVTTATDVYALGLILHELLTGQRAQKMKTSTEFELQRAICEAPAEKPSTVDRHIPGDLDNIVLMALRKEPERRYQSVEQLSEDVGRYLEGRTVSAREDSFGYRARKFLQRNWLLSAVAALAVLIAVGGVVSTLRQADRAQRRFTQVRKLANTFLFDFHDRIQNLPGSTETRAFVVSTALTYLDSLAGEAQDDVTLQRELADAYLKIGDVQGLQGSANLGKPLEARASYQKALAIATEVHRRDPGEASLLLLSRIRRRQGMTEAAVGDTKLAVDLETQSVDLAKQAAQAGGGGPETRRQLIASEGQLGMLLMNQGRLPEAIEHLRSALAGEEQESSPADIRGAFRLGEARYNLGSTLKMAGAHVEALAQLDQARTLVEQTAVRTPNDIRPASLLMNIHKDLGDILSSPFSSLDMDNVRAAREYAEQARIAEQLLANDPKNQTAAFTAFIALASLAEVQGYTDPKVGLETNARAKALHDQFAPVHTGNLFSERGLMNVYAINGALRYANGQYAEAEADATRALALAESMYRRDPKRFLLVRDRVFGFTRRAQALMKLGRLAEAESDLAACRKLTPQLPAKTSRNRDIRECADCFETSGQLARLRKAGRPLEVEYFSAALEHWRTMKARGQRSKHIDERIARLEGLVRESGGQP